MGSEGMAVAVEVAVGVAAGVEVAVTATVAAGARVEVGVATTEGGIVGTEVATGDAGGDVAVMVAEGVAVEPGVASAAIFVGKIGALSSCVQPDVSSVAMAIHNTAITGRVRRVRTRELSLSSAFSEHGTLPGSHVCQLAEDAITGAVALN